MAKHVHHDVSAFFIVINVVIDHANDFYKELFGPRLAKTVVKETLSLSVIR